MENINIQMQRAMAAIESAKKNGNSFCTVEGLAPATAASLSYDKGYDVKTKVDTKRQKIISVIPVVPAVSGHGTLNVEEAI